MPITPAYSRPLAILAGILGVIALAFAGIYLRGVLAQHALKDGPIHFTGKIVGSTGSGGSGIGSSFSQVFTIATDSGARVKSTYTINPSLGPDTAKAAELAKKLQFNTEVPGRVEVQASYSKEWNEIFLDGPNDYIRQIQ